MIMLDSLLEKDLLPDWLIRAGIRKLLADRLREEKKENCEAQAAHLSEYVEMLKQSPIAVQMKAANDQHYEVPSEFYRLVLGRRLKYSSAYWLPDTRTLDQAEEAMLELTISRAQIQTGQSILELGCGWGSLSIYMAERYPENSITSVSNSRTQKEFIDAEIIRKGLRNLKIITADMNDFRTDQEFDRIVSVEMFEHMRNYELLLDRISEWLRPEGKLFVHIFTHKKYAYLFEAKANSDWMSRTFFTGGQMPSDSLLLYFQKNLMVVQHWAVSGRHYSRTAECWLENMDRNRSKVLEIFSRAYGPAEVRRWWVYWRAFFMACAELWSYSNGEEWIVSHYLFKRRES